MSSSANLLRSARADAMARGKEAAPTAPVFRSKLAFAGEDATTSAAGEMTRDLLRVLPFCPSFPADKWRVPWSNSLLLAHCPHRTQPRSPTLLSNGAAPQLADSVQLVQAPGGGGG